MTGPENWSAPALTAYLGLMTVTGYGVARVRRWGLTGLATLTGAGAWALAGFAAEGYLRVAALSLGPLLLACTAVAWRRKTSGSDRDGFDLRDPFSLMPVSAFVLAGLLLGALNLAGLFVDTSVELLPAAGGGALLFAIAGAVAVRRGLVPAAVLGLAWVPALACAAMFYRPVNPGLLEMIGIGLIVGLAASGVIATAGNPQRLARLSAGGGALVALVIALVLSGPITEAAPWSPGVMAALILLGAAVIMARTSPGREADLPLAFWIWAAGAAGLWSLNEGVDAPFLPLATAALSLAAAGLHARLGWRGFAGVMLAGATAAIAALMSAELFQTVATKAFAWWGLGIVTAAGAGLALAGARLANRPDRPRQIVEAQSTAALIIGIAGIGMMLRLAAVSPAEGGNLDPFLEAALRSLTILAAGLLSALAVREDSSLIGRWRGQIMLCVGLAHVLIFQVVVLNPFWGWWTPKVAGPPVLDSILVAYLAPAILVGIAIWKKVALNRILLAVYAAGSGLLTLIWLLMEMRRLFQGASLAGGFDLVGRAEAGAYAVIVLGAALAMRAIAKRVLPGERGFGLFAREIALLGRWSSWAALALALIVFGYGASPWWGPVGRPLAGVQATVLLFGMYAAGAVGVFLIGVTAPTDGAGLLQRASRISTVIVAFAMLNLIVRLAFRGFDMRPNTTDASLETWAFSAIWGLYGFGLLVWGGVRRSPDLRGTGLAALGITLAKIFLFDMARLDGVIRAASFLAVGALLMAAAVIMRRLGGSEALPFGLGGKPKGAGT